jgi:hypothetical protein
MRNRTRIITGVAGLLAVGVWALFRPEYIFIDVRVDEPFPGVAVAAGGDAPRALESGVFHGVAHATNGVASIYDIGGRKVLRLTGLSTSFGPDVRVVLLQAPDAADNGAVRNAGYLEVGPLKGNIGDQNYDLPPGFDPARHKAVTLWCRRFSVNFATAPLQSVAG